MLKMRIARLLVVVSLREYRGFPPAMPNPDLCYREMLSPIAGLI